MAKGEKKENIFSNEWIIHTKADMKLSSKLSLFTLPGFICGKLAVRSRYFWSTKCYAR